MIDFLHTLGGLTLGGSLVISILALLSRLSRSTYAARWRCCAWLLLCLRLALPLSFPEAAPLPYQPPIQLPVPSDTIIYQSPSSSEKENPSPIPTPPIPQASPTTSSEPPQSSPSLPDSRTALSVSQILFGGWLVGAIAILLWMTISHIRFLRYLKRWSRPADDARLITAYNRWGNQLKLDQRPKLLICPGLPAPMLAGLIRPALLLPEDAACFSNPGYAILHELTHYRRKDIWLKALALWVNVIHWFNPLVWYMVRMIERDTELACDESALRQLPPEEHSAYGRTILEAVDRLKLRSDERSPS